MEVKLLSESGYEYALSGISLSYKACGDIEIDNSNEFEEKFKIDIEPKVKPIALKLKDRECGENKFLRQIQLIIDLKAPLSFWKQFDTYKVGTTAQSESTMHSIMAKEFDIDMFETSYMSDNGISLLDAIINELNCFRGKYLKNDNEKEKKEIWYDIISILPECWLQERIVSLNYAVLKDMYLGRKNHKLYEWRYFLNSMLKSISYPEFIYI